MISTYFWNYEHQPSQDQKYLLVIETNEQEIEEARENE